MGKISALRMDAEQIIAEALSAVQPDEAVRRALGDVAFEGRIVLIAVGKAAWQMAHAAYDVLGDRISSGVVITKYQHAKGRIGSLTCYEAGHPVPDENTLRATQAACEAVRGLTAQDTVLFLLSGGGSALFEQPLVSLSELQDITEQLLASGADIREINTVRKRLSAVKGGKFAQLCQPAQVFSVILSDIVGDPIDMIASGPVSSDHSTAEQALAVVKKYALRLSPRAEQLLHCETPKVLENVQIRITGSVRELCDAALRACETLDYHTVLLTDRLECEAREAGRFLAAIAGTHALRGDRLAFLAGGETVVHLTGKGKGGRNQELALAAAQGLTGLPAAIFSVGSDGTDGPTDAAGGYVDGMTAETLSALGFDIAAELRDNNAYPTLAAVDGLIHTGPTGTNVNDFSVLLIER